MIDRVFLAVLLVGGCAGASKDADTGGIDTDGTDTGPVDTDTTDTTDTDRPVNDPPNPAGLGPAPVDLGLEGDLSAPESYVLLAATGITNVTGSMITDGHVGLTPAAASFITGFDLIADPSNLFATSVAVAPPGKVYAADYASPTPTDLTSAMLAMQAAYTDAASRWPPDELNLASGDLSGLTLEPGLYTWGSTVIIPSDVTVSGGADDVWIFQISNDLDVSTGQQVILAGGAQAKNIFWQVAGQTTIHADAHFEGIVLSQTGITLQTNASMNGRLLAQSLIALDDNSVTAP